MANYQCPGCNYSSEKYIELIRHKKCMSHWQEETCSVCGFVFNGNEYMKRHVGAKTHGGTSENNCGHRYVNVRGLHRHTRTKHRATTETQDKKQKDFVPEYVQLLAELRKLINANKKVN